MGRRSSCGSADGANGSRPTGARSGLKRFGGADRRCGAITTAWSPSRAVNCGSFVRSRMESGFCMVSLLRNFTTEFTEDTEERMTNLPMTNDEHNSFQFILRHE